jgi:ATP-dependent Clp protease protease subunit
MLNIPGCLHKDSNGNERLIDISTRLLQDRIVLVQGEVTDELAESVVAQLLHLESVDNQAPITLFVSGPGGSVMAGLSILDTMDMISCPVSTVITGEVASMSSMIALGGDKGRRKIMPHARVMLHSVSAGVQGKVQDMKITLEETLKIQDMLMNMIAEKCGKDIEQVKKDCERDYWMSAEEAIKYGCCDELVKSRKGN